VHEHHRQPTREAVARIACLQGGKDAVSMLPVTSPFLPPIAPDLAHRSEPAWVGKEHSRDRASRSDMNDSSSLPLLQPREGITATNPKRTAFNSDARLALLNQVAGISLAIVVVVEPTGPLAGSVRLHGNQCLNADQGSVAFRRVDIVLVRHWPTGCGIVSRTGLRNEAAQVSTARAYPYRRAVFGQPCADRRGDSGFAARYEKDQRECHQQ
jgi:hypothetical protein